MNYLPALRSLLATIDQGSLSAAARTLRISQPAVSQQIAALEAALGQPLLHRSRVGVRATAAGLAAVPHARTAVAAVDALRESVAALADGLTGRLRVSAPSFLAELILVPVIADLGRVHPGLRIELLSEDRLIDLDIEGVDLAFRAGSPGTGGGKVRRIADIDVCLVATPDYLNAAGWPAGPDDLERLAYIQYNENPDEVTLPLRGPDGPIAAAIRPAFAARMAPLLLHAVRNHMGFARVGRAIVADDLSAGRLVELLPQTPPLDKPLYLVTATAFAPSRRATEFLSRVSAAITTLDGLKLIAELT